MSLLALSLIVLAAFGHSTWNYYFKTSRVKPVFIWWCHVVAVVLYAPVGMLWWQQSTISPLGWATIIATSVLHAIYFTFLGMAYETGELSVVYPVARGLAPLLIPLLAIATIGEVLSPLGAVGIICVLIGIYVLQFAQLSIGGIAASLRTTAGRSCVWALSTGVTIAAYSIVDKIGVTNVSPPLYIYLMAMGTLILLTPHIFATRRTGVLPEWRVSKKAIGYVGCLLYLTYMLVLFAMTMSKVSYVAALRESSIVFSMLYGTLVLGEPANAKKAYGGGMVLVGAILIAFSTY